MTKSEQSELLQEFNSDIVMAMLKFFKTQKGRLTAERRDEFTEFVCGKVKESPTFFLFTKLEMLKPLQITIYATKMSGEFYSQYYKNGKERLAADLSSHLSA